MLPRSMPLAMQTRVAPCLVTVPGPYAEWRDDSAPGEPGGWDVPQQLEPPLGWPGSGTYVPGNDYQPAWDDP